MPEAVFIARNLTKQHRHLLALDNMNMEIRRGDIYGFIGQNGAGKTTLMRILAGTVKQTSGEIELFGENIPSKLYRQQKYIGGIVEKPGLYPNLSALDNLEVCRLQRGIDDKSCINDVLKSVHLMDTANKKVKDFSLGMKQRLGIAMALLGNREFLFLDEPVNGLDPIGIVEFRELMKKLNHERGITLLISSHMLNELHKLATCYGFIHKGKMIEQITTENLSQKCKKYLYVRVDDVQNAVMIMKTVFNASRLEIISRNTIHIYELYDKTGEIMKELILGGVSVEEISIKGFNLEKYYLSLIGGV